MKSQNQGAVKGEKNSVSVITNTNMYWFLKKHLFLFSLSALLSSIVLGSAYLWTLQSLKKNMRNNNEDRVEQIANIIDVRLAEVENLVTVLSMHYLTNRMLFMDNHLNWNMNPDDIIAVQQYTNELTSYKVSSNFIEIAVYSELNNWIFTARGKMTYEEWYRKYFVDVPFTAQEWKQAAMNADGKLICSCVYNPSSVPTRVIPFVQKLPVGSKKNYLGYICIMLDPEILYLDAGMIDTGIDLFVKNSSGEFILLPQKYTDLAEKIPALESDKGSRTVKYKGNKLEISYYRAKSDLLFVAVADYEDVFRSLTPLWYSFIFTISLSFILLFMGIIIFGKNLQKPYQKILSDYDVLSEIIEMQKAEIKTSALGLLIAGHMNETMESLRASNVFFYEKGFYYVLVFQFKSFGENSSVGAIALLNTCLMEHLDKPYFYTVTVNSDSITLIRNIRENEVVAERHYIELMMDDIRSCLKESNIDIRVYGGQLYKSVSDISRSYKEAVFAARNYKGENKEKICWYTETETYYYCNYGDDIENQIIFSVQNGDKDQTKELIELVYRNNYIDYKSSISSNRILMSRLRITLATIVESLKGFQEDYKSVHIVEKPVWKEYPENVEFEELGNIFLQLCDEFAEIKMNKKNQFLGQLKEFVDKNYTDPNMSLIMVADKFQKSEAYISKNFKQVNGNNFAAYVEEKRMQKAVDLIREGVKLDDISSLLGYGSSHSFRRAFKRKYGISPREYKMQNFKK